MVHLAGFVLFKPGNKLGLFAAHQQVSAATFLLQVDDLQRAPVCRHAGQIQLEK